MIGRRSRLSAIALEHGDRIADFAATKAESMEDLIAMLDELEEAKRKAWLRRSVTLGLSEVMFGLARYCGLLDPD